MDMIEKGVSCQHMIYSSITNVNQQIDKTQFTSCLGKVSARFHFAIETGYWKEETH
jgi:hypothetical protein